MYLSSIIQFNVFLPPGFVSFGLLSDGNIG
jgi:hypothetical protein